MISFDAAHAAIHYPPDRRIRIWIRPSILITAALVVLLPVLAAWLEVLLVGLPHIPPVPQVYPNNFAGPHGFPLWVRYCHFFNFLFVMMLIRSGLSILVDHPRLYFNDGCTPGSEWIRLTPLKVPRDRIWTAKDDARYISFARGTERVLWIQRSATNCVFRSRLLIRSFSYSDWHRHVAGHGESLSLVCSDVWRSSIGAFHSFSYHDQFFCVHRRACDLDRDDRIRTEHEPHRYRYRRPGAAGHGFGVCWYRPGLLFVDCGTLHLMEPPAHAAACLETRSVSDATPHFEPAFSPAKIYRARYLTLLLAQWKDARKKRLEASCGERFPRFPVKGRRIGRKANRAFSRRHRKAWRKRAYYHASLHPGMERYCEVGWHPNEDAYRISASKAGSESCRLLFVW